MRPCLRTLGAAFAVLLALTLAPKPPTAAVASSGRCAAAYPTFDGRPRRGASCIPLVIMPLGDSITYGYQSSGGDGYRGPLQDLINARRREAWQFAGSVVDARGLRHEGHGGWTCVQMAAALDGWLPVVTPVALRVSVVLLDAGTNDTRAGATGPDTAACLEQLLLRIAAREPEARVVLAQIAITTAAAPAVRQEQRALNGALPALAAAHGARLVDMTGVELDPDGIHPDDAGYADMAGRWMAALTGWI